MSDWRDTREYRVWRATVIMRDRRCVICNSIKSRHAHHVNHSTYFPDDRFDPDNGVCLCSKCHSNFHCNFKRSTREKCDRYDFDNFLCLVSYLFGIKNDKIKTVLDAINFAHVIHSIEEAHKDGPMIELRKI